MHEDLIEQLREYAAAETDRYKAQDLREAADIIERLQGNAEETPRAQEPCRRHAAEGQGGG